MHDITAIGELLIDFTPSGTDTTGDILFARKPGGAPANVLAANRKLGGKCAFIGKVGNDFFGHFLKDTLDCLGIDSSGLIMDTEVPTTLAFVHLDKKGDRSFSFYRKPGADLMLRIDEVTKTLIDNCHILHFGSVSMTDEPSRSATLQSVKYAKSCDKIISFDPNYRPFLWNNIDTARKQMLTGLALSDIVKVSEEELSLLTNTDDIETGASILAKSGATLILVSCGAHGAYYRLGNLFGRVATFDVKTIDTNGAGDTFLGAVLFKLSGFSLSDIKGLSREALVDILTFANAAGALTTTKNGAIPAMPNLDNIYKCIKKIKTLV